MMVLVNEAYPSGNSSVDMTKAVALVDILLWSLEVRLTAQRREGEKERERDKREFECVQHNIVVDACMCVGEWGQAWL